MNFKNHPLFIITALILFFPIGLIFLIRSDQPAKRKWILASAGSILFLSILSLSFLFPAKETTIDDFDVYATREQLTVGESGGIFLTDGTKYITEYTVSADSDVLSLNNNVYTAQQVGSAQLVVSSNGIEKQIQVDVVEGDSTLETVYFSPSGKRYHKNKSHAGKNSIEMIEEDALQSQKTPCSICYKK